MSIEVGNKAIVKVGRNEVQVQIVEVRTDEYQVKSLSSGKEFTVRKIERIIAEVAPKKMSLLDAAVEVQRAAKAPLNTKEMVEQAIVAGLWKPTACKTPAQTLYGAIFREIATKEQPRIVKSTIRKGAFVATE